MATSNQQKMGTRTPGAGSGGDKDALASAIGDGAKTKILVRSMPAPEKLIPVREGKICGVKCMVVDARDLYLGLGVGRDFTRWIKHRIAEYGFTEGQDYEEQTCDRNVLANKTLSRWSGDRTFKQIVLTMETAKGLAMVERTARGRDMLRYFIRCEQELLAKRASRSPAAAMTSEGRDCLRFIRERCLHGAVVEYARSLEIVGKQKPEIAWGMAPSLVRFRQGSSRLSHYSHAWSWISGPGNWVPICAKP